MTINNPAYKKWLDSTVNPFESIMVLEKSEVSEVDLSDISEALEEYVRLFKAEIASPAEILTLSRAYPDEEKYSLAVIDKELDQKEPVVVGGPASVEVVDREGHLITVDAMKRAFDRFMANFRTRNAMVLHSDVQVGWALPAYISKSGKIYKSGVTGDHLFFITELRDDTKISKRVLDQISDGKMKSYSIAGSATSVEAMQKASGMVMQVNDMELAEVTICEQGVNQKAKFELMKSDAERPTTSCVDGSCLIKSQEHKHSETEVFMDENGIIDTVGSFTNWVQKETINDPEDQPQKVVNKEDTSNQGLIEDMQKGHLQGCVCETCGSASSWADKHADDSSRDATDRQGRPTLGHTGHGHAVAILISRMHRKASDKKKLNLDPGDTEYIPYEDEGKSGGTPISRWNPKHPDYHKDSPKVREKKAQEFDDPALSMEKAVYEYMNKARTKEQQDKGLEAQHKETKSKIEQPWRHPHSDTLSLHPNQVSSLRSRVAEGASAARAGGGQKGVETRRKRQLRVEARPSLSSPRSDPKHPEHEPLAEGSPSPRHATPEHRAERRMGLERAHDIRYGNVQPAYYPKDYKKPFGQGGGRDRTGDHERGGRDRTYDIDHTVRHPEDTKPVNNMQKAVYEYINKAYKVPSKEELAAAADKRKEKAIADAKERYGESFTPKDTSQRRKRKYVPAAPAAADRRTAAQDAWRKANPGQPDQESFSSMVKALLKFVSMTSPKPKSGNTGTPAVPNQPAGSDDGTKPPDVKPDPEPEETVSKPKDTSQPWVNTGGKGGGVIGNIVRSAQDIAGVRHGQQKEAMQNMEKQELEWVTPQVETPLHKFLDYNNQRGS